MCLYGERPNWHMQHTIQLLQLRLKDRHARELREQARAVNLLWNYCNELSVKVWEREGRFLSGCGASGFFGHRFGVKRVIQTGVFDVEES